MTPDQLMTCTGCRSRSLAEFWLPWLAAAMTAYGIDTPNRQADFLAQIGHESGGLRYTSELWGPTTAQRGYEGRADLGNYRPGDGSFFRGHGLLQTTGRANHARVRDRLRAKFPERQVPDFELYPAMLAQPEWAALSAADFWDEHKCNVWSDMDSCDGVSDIINRGHKTRAEGDANGFAERQALTLAARKALS